jgi:hypothetical protein
MTINPRTHLRALFFASFKALHSLYLETVSMIHSVISLPCPDSSLRSLGQDYTRKLTEKILLNV